MNRWLGSQTQAPAFLLMSFLVWIGFPTLAGEDLQIELAPASPVVGRVLDGAGTQIGGAAVTAWEVGDSKIPVRSDPSAARTVTGAAGRFRLEGLVAGRTYRLEAEHPARGFGALSWVVGSPGEVGLKLSPYASLTGRVVDLEGNALEGVRVTALAAEDSRDPQEWKAESAPNGKFLLAGLPPGSHEVEIRRQGYALVRLHQVPLVAGRSTALGDVVLRPGAALAVRVVTADGTPILRARVRLLVPVEPWSEKLLREVLTDEDGSLQLDDLGRDRLLRLRVTKAGYLEERLPTVRPGGAEIVVVLRPAAAVRGHVTSRAGIPIVGAQIFVDHSEPLPATDGRARRPFERLEGSETEEDGSYEVLDIPAGELRFRVQAEGYVRPEERWVVVDEGAAVEGVDFELTAGAVVEGEVIDSDGLPVARSHVQIADAGAFADAKGRYRITGVELGEQTATVAHPDYAEVREEFEVGEGENTLVLTLEKGEEVAGEAVNPDGEPLSGAFITLRVPAAGGRFYSTTADGDGRFHFPSVDDGEYVLSGELAGFADARLEAPVAVPGTANEALQLVLEPGVLVRGRVLGLDVAELSDVRVEAETAAGLIKPGILNFDGAFEVHDLAAGRWLLRASLADGSQHAQVRLLLHRGDEEVEQDLEFEGGLSLSGQVLYDEHGLAAVNVTLRGNQLAVARRVLTDQEGRFEIENLAAGPYLLSLRHTREQLVHNEEFFLDSHREVTIRLETGSLSGRVRDFDSGAPLGAALLALRRVVTSPEEFPFLITNGTGEKGSFYIPRVPAGRYRLTVHKDGYAEHSAQIDVAAGQELDPMEIELAATQGLELVIHGAGRQPPFVNARLTHTGTGQVLQQSRGVDAGGRSSFATVPAGDWELVMGAPGASLTTLFVAVPGPPVEVRLLPGSQLVVNIEALADSDQLASAVVVGADGRLVEAVVPGGALQDTWTIRAGTGVIEGVPPGVWTVRAQVPDGRSWVARVLAQGEAQIPVSLE